MSPLSLLHHLAVDQIMMQPMTLYGFVVQPLCNAQMLQLDNQAKVKQDLKGPDMIAQDDDFVSSL